MTVAAKRLSAARKLMADVYAIHADIMAGDGVGGAGPYPRRRSGKSSRSGCSGGGG